MARVLEADAQARIAGAALLPSLSGNFGATRERAEPSAGGSLNTLTCTARAYRPAIRRIFGAETVTCTMPRWRGEGQPFRS